MFISNKSAEKKSSAKIKRILTDAYLPSDEEMRDWKTRADVLAIPVQDDDTTEALEELERLKTDKDFCSFYENLPYGKKADILLRLIAKYDLRSLSGYKGGNEPCIENRW